MQEKCRFAFPYKTNTQQICLERMPNQTLVLNVVLKFSKISFIIHALYAILLFLLL